MPLVWAKSAVFAALLASKRAGDGKGAAEWAKKGARIARLALGDDSGVAKKFESLGESLRAAASGRAPAANAKGKAGRR